LYTYIAVFLYVVRWRHNRAPNLEPCFRSIFTSFRKDSVASYAWIWTVFSVFVRGPDVLCKHYTLRRSVCRWRHKIRKTAVKILQSINNRTQSLREILRVVNIYIVINYTHLKQHMRVTISCRYALSVVGRFFCF